MSWSMQSLPDFTDEDFERWRKLLEERSGIHLVPQQRTFLKSQLSIRMRELGGISADDYYNQLRDGVRGMVEWSNLLDRLVVKETSFFRHIPSFDFIRNQVLQKIASGQMGSSFDVWSVGCATGEEPYSLAMLLNECFSLAESNVFWGVQATDISLQALNYGRKGIYPLRKADMVDSDI
ncbi:MAG: protein-glutamate O-methyltransferase CheR, partial [Pseudomonadales bacterium]|nr:protein-glutamate O-methyltransferase CheR [Pseudomonadales bacterium]